MLGGFFGARSSGELPDIHAEPVTNDELAPCLKDLRARQDACIAWVRAKVAMEVRQASKKDWTEPRVMVPISAAEITGLIARFQLKKYHLRAVITYDAKQNKCGVAPATSVHVILNGSACSFEWTELEICISFTELEADSRGKSCLD
jgi:hypothetical protein